MASSPRPTKRRRVSSGFISPVTPLSPSAEASDDGRLVERAIKVLRVEADAVANVAELYATDRTAQTGLADAVSTILDVQRNNGKLIVCGVGKSAYIGMKFVATCKSLGVRASFMHACEAVHGDLGDVQDKDVVLLVSFSGKTPELLNLMPHLPEAVPVVALTSHTKSRDCSILAGRKRGILLPAPILEKEEISFGVSAPTTSTTVALAVSDMLGLTIANSLHREKTRDVFRRNHPGGAIGMTHREVEELKNDGVDVSVVELPSPSISAEIED